MAEVYALETPGADGETDTLFSGPTLKSVESRALNIWSMVPNFSYTIVVLDMRVAAARVLRTKARKTLAQYVKQNAAAYDAELEATSVQA